jgi:hypothetical protein
MAEDHTGVSYHDDYDAYDEYDEDEYYADDLETENGDEPEPSPDESGEPASDGWRERLRRWRRRVLIALALAAVLVILILAASWYIAREPDPTSEFAETLEQGGEPDFTEGAGWPPGVPVITKTTFPARIKHELTFSGEQHGYEFAGRAGDTWLITATPRGDSTLDPVVSVYLPDGSEFASNDDRAAGDLSAGLRITLPVDGAYRVLVESSQGGITTGAYTLVAEYVDA